MQNLGQPFQFIVHSTFEQDPLLLPVVPDVAGAALHIRGGLETQPALDRELPDDDRAVREPGVARGLPAISAMKDMREP